MLPEPRPASPLRIVVTGGGTSGHVSPALAIVAALRQLRPDVELLYLGSRGGPEEREAVAANIPFAAIQTGKLRRYLSIKNLADQFRLPVGLAQSLALLRKFRPHAILATGGYVAVPPVVAAGLLHLPVLIHEQTAQLGLANRICARFANTIALSWEASLPCVPPRLRHKCRVTGNPVRESLFVGVPERAAAALDLGDEPLPLVYFTGGSLGARVINRAVEGALPQLLQVARVVHQCGEQPREAEPDLLRLQRAAAALPPKLSARYAVRAFLREELADVLAAASLVVGRSGAGTVTELCALGKPALFVPLVPTGGDEQTRNAQLCVAAGSAVIVEQASLTAATLLEAVVPLLSEPGRLQEMGRAALTLAHPGAAHELACLVVQLADPKWQRPAGAIA